MLDLSLAISIFLFVMAGVNSRRIRIPRNGRDLTATVAVLLPVRNEAVNVIEFVESLKAQTGISDLKFYFLDDNSEDELRC